MAVFVHHFYPNICRYDRLNNVNVITGSEAGQRGVQGAANGHHPGETMIPSVQ